ncbi:MAG: DUF2721 domain-containing protein [Armatimonadota bacterium]
MGTDQGSNPFAVLSLIVAPAVLTNAASVLIMSTSNRLARAVDRARVLSAELEQKSAPADERTPFRLRELEAVEQRSFMLLAALRHFYAALAGFASAALLSLLGAVLARSLPAALLQALEAVAVLAGLFAVGSLVLGAATLIRETRIAVLRLQERTVELRRSLEDRTTPHGD